MIAYVDDEELQMRKASRIHEQTHSGQNVSGLNGHTLFFSSPMLARITKI